MYLALGDQYGNVVADDNSGTLTVSILQDFDSKLTYNPIIEGKTRISAQNGAFLVEGLIFTGTPTGAYSLSFSADSIN